MKKLIFCALLVISAFSVNAQTRVYSEGNTTSVPDTFTNPTTKYFNIARKNTAAAMVVQVNGTKVSGTVKGYAYLQGSNDAENPHIWSIISDSLTFANGNNTKQFTISPNNLLYTRLVWIQVDSNQQSIVRVWEHTK